MPVLVDLLQLGKPCNLVVACEQARKLDAKYEFPDCMPVRNEELGGEPVRIRENQGRRASREIQGFCRTGQGSGSGSIRVACT